MTRSTRGVPVRLAVWAFHLPLLGLWLLLAVPAADVLLEHHPTHFWLVVAVAVVLAASWRLTWWLWPWSATGPTPTSPRSSTSRSGRS